MPHIELIVRAVIRHGDKILLAHRKGEPNTFLPGGHMEPGEYAEDSLRRELREELGLDSTIVGFVGVLEHKFMDRHGKDYEEINLIFEAEIDEKKPESIERHLEFMWTPLTEFKRLKMLPSSLPKWLEEWERTGLSFHHAQNDLSPHLELITIKMG
jgi:8-oxo-dGTP diphosphatase